MSTKISGALKANQVTVHRLSVDRSRGQRIEVLAGLTHSKTGATHGWVDDSEVKWSDETRMRLASLLESVEHDLVRAHFEEGSEELSSERGSSGLEVPSGGLGERLGTAEGPHSI